MQLVLFDIDGTLTLTNESDDRCFLLALTEALGWWWSLRTWLAGA